MKNYELIAMLMKLPAGYEVISEKKITKEDLHGEDYVYSEGKVNCLKVYNMPKQISLLS